MVTEIFRNFLSNFNLVFPLTLSGDLVSGKTSELDSATIKIYYRNTSNNWVAATYSGSPVEIGSLGIYTITILSSWFTNRDDTYPMTVAIIDDTTPTKTWDDQIFIINPNLQLEKLKVQNADDYEPSVEIDSLLILATANSPGLEIESYYAGQEAVFIEASDDKAVSISSSSNEAIYIGGETHGLNIWCTSGPGIYIEGFGGEAILLNSYSTNATFRIINSSTGQDFKCSEVDGIKAITDNLVVKRNTAYDNFPIFMVDSRDKISGKTGLTITATRSIDGGAFSACSNSVSEISDGAYKINLSANDLNGRSIILLFTADTALPRRYSILTSP